MTLRIFANHYRLDALAKRGGMGSVYEGTDLRDGSKVAIKLVGTSDARRGEASQHPGSSLLLRQRFAREAAALAATSHPHIARYLDHGEQADTDFLVMSWVSGVTLRERLELGPLDDLDAVILGQKLASALVHLAEREIVHRDIKPENIMLPQGNLTAPILVDLGIVQQKADAQLTQLGSLLGTPRYMSPEQVRTPSQVDGRADVFSLGCVLFECLTGRAVFDADDPVAILSSILLDVPPRIASLRAHTPVALDECIAQLLAPARAKRPSAAVAHSMLMRIENWVQTPSSPGRASASVAPAAHSNTLASAVGAPDLRRVRADYAQGAALQSAQPVVAARARRRSAHPSSPLVGREDVLASASQVLTQRRWVVLWGAPGIGKTRLAHAIAPQQNAVFVNAPRDLAGVLEALGLSVQSANEYFEAQENSLYVFDGCEAFIDELCAAVASWSAQAMGARFVCTSRRAPSLRDCPLIRLAPLSPESGAALLALEIPQGAAWAAPESQLRELSRAFDGNPLALKLAAARYSLLGFRGLMDRAARPLDVLSGDSGDQMRRLIAASWDLLPVQAQQMLAACSIFEGVFFVQDACELFERLSEGEALSRLDLLRVHSLLSVEHAALPAPAAAPAAAADTAPEHVQHLRLANVIREFAADELSRSGLAGAVRDRRSDALLRVARRALEGFQRSGNPDDLARLSACAGGVRAALARCIEGGDGARALALALVLEPLGTERGVLDAALERLDTVLALPGSASAGERAPAQAKQARARILGSLGRFDEAEPALLEVIGLARDSGDLDWLQHATVDLAVVLHQRGSNVRARELYERVLEESDGDGRRAEGRALANLGALLHDEGQFANARVFYIQAASLLESLGDARHGGTCVANLAVLEVECGRFEQADRRFEQALAWLERAGDIRLSGIALGNYGMFCMERGELPRAAELLGEARHRLAHAGDLRSEAIATARLGAVHALRGDLEGAEVALARAKRIAARRDPLTRQAVDIQFVLFELAHARAAAQLGDVAAAQSWLTAAETRRDAADAPLSLRGGSAAQRSDDVRAALRTAAPLFQLLTRAIAAR